MHKRPLGTSTVKVTPLTLGTWAIGGWLWGGTNEKEAIEAIHTSIDHGITSIDTAAVYGMGLSETLVGKAIKFHRDKVTIATKCGLRWDSNEGSDPLPSFDTQGHPVTLRRNSHPKSILYECEQSLKRLGVDHIDLYQIHWPDTSTPIEASWGAMVQLLEQGKVRAIGVSNYNLSQLKAAHALFPVHSIQCPYSLIRRSIENEILPFCESNNIAFLAYSSLERGLLTGKISEKHHFPKGDHREDNPTFSLENRKKVHAALSRIQPIAQQHKASLSQLILNCTFHMQGITTALVGARSSAQAKENADAMQLSLSYEERIRIVDAFSSIEL